MLPVRYSAAEVVVEAVGAAVVVEEAVAVRVPVGARMPEVAEFVAAAEFMHHRLADRGMPQAAVDTFPTLESAVAILPTLESVADMFPRLASAVEVISLNGHRQIMCLPCRIQIREVFDRETFICQPRAIVASATDPELQED